MVEQKVAVQAILNVQREMEQLQIRVLVGVVQDLARHQTDYFVPLILTDIHVQEVEQAEVEQAEVEQVEVEQVVVEVEATVVVRAVLNVQREMAQLQIRVLVGVVRHIARHQMVYFVNMQKV